MPRGTQDTPRALQDFAYGAITLFGGPFQALPLSIQVPCWSPTTPARIASSRFGLFPWALWLPWAFYCVLLLRPICNKPQFPKRAVLRLHLHNNSASARGRRRRGLITLLPQRGKADNALVYLDSAEGQWEGPLAGVWGGWLTWAGLLMSPIHQKTLLHYLQERILRKRASWTMRGVSSVVHYLRRPTEVCVCHL